MQVVRGGSRGETKNLWSPVERLGRAAAQGRQALAGAYRPLLGPWTQYDNFIPNSMRRLPPLKICGLRNVPAGTLVRLVKP